MAPSVDQSFVPFQIELAMPGGSTWPTRSVGNRGRTGTGLREQLRAVRYYTTATTFALFLTLEIRYGRVAASCSKVECFYSKYLQAPQSEDPQTRTGVVPGAG